MLFFSSFHVHIPEPSSKYYSNASASSNTGCTVGLERRSCFIFHPDNLRRHHNFQLRIFNVCSLISFANLWFLSAHVQSYNFHPYGRKKKKKSTFVLNMFSVFKRSIYESGFLEMFPSVSSTDFLLPYFLFFRKKTVKNCAAERLSLLAIMSFHQQSTTLNVKLQFSI